MKSKQTLPYLVLVPSGDFHDHDWLFTVKQQLRSIRAVFSQGGEELLRSAKEDGS